MCYPGYPFQLDQYVKGDQKKRKKGEKGEKECRYYYLVTLFIPLYLHSLTFFHLLTV